MIFPVVKAFCDDNFITKKTPEWDGGIHYIDDDFRKGLTEDGIRTVTGKERWNPSSVLSILHNEKYMGDCLMQKYYVGDFLTKKLVKNQGELQQYYVKGYHEPIISEEVFRAAQQRLDANSTKSHQSGVRDFSSMIVCGDCGAFYGSKVWHSNDKYRKVVYRCNRKYSGKKCATPSVDEKRLQEMFVEAINQILGSRDEIIENIERFLAIKKERNHETAIRETAVALDRAETAYRALIEKQKTKSSREMTTPLFLLRCLEAGISIRDLDLLTIGMVLDIWTEKGNDEAKYKTVASVRIAGQKDFDAF